ncbi:MAG: hypothetical protein ACJA01_000843 [Saprospiraceae bacterium]
MNETAQYVRRTLGGVRGRNDRCESIARFSYSIV